MKYFLTIAASDTSGGAGIQQDLKMAQRLNFWGLNVVTALTIQDFRHVYYYEPVNDSFFYNQLYHIFNSFNVSAIKIGVIPNLKFAMILCQFLEKVSCPIVLDPVFKATSGFNFSKDEPLEIIKLLAKFVTVITPNIPELEYLYDIKFTKENDLNITLTQKDVIKAKNLYVKGGHFLNDSIVEFLVKGNKILKFEYEKQDWSYSHGTGCAFSSLLSILLSNNSIETACRKARENLVSFYSALTI